MKTTFLPVSRFAVSRFAPSRFALLAAAALFAAAPAFEAQAQDAGGAPSWREGRGAGREGGFGGGREGGFGGRERAGRGGGFGERGGGFGAGGERGAGRFGGGRGAGGRFGAPAERASYAPLELHGIMGRGENALVSITSLETGESQWVRVRDGRAKWYVESVNPRARRATVRMDGMTIDLQIIPTTGDGTPAGVRPGPRLTAIGGVEGAAVGGDATAPAGGDTAFDAKGIAAQMLAARDSGQRPTPEQMQAFGEQMRGLTREQRSEVFNQFRQIQEAPAGAGAGAGTPPSAATPGAGAAGAAGAAPAPAAAPTPSAAPTPVAQPAPAIQTFHHTEVINITGNAPHPVP